MASALLHLAMGDLDKLDPDNIEYSSSYRKAYVLGILLPDIAKRKFIDNIEEFHRYFNGCLEDDILTYDEYIEFSEIHHFNPNRQDTNNPNLRTFVETSYVDLRKPVWQGVLCHLMGDKAFYYKTYCADFQRAMQNYINGDKRNGKTWVNSETGRVWYEDYDILRKPVEEEYKITEKLEKIISIELTKELQEKFNIKYSVEKTETEYMNWNNIKKYINKSHLLLKYIDNGEIEKILTFFDGEDIDKIFEG